MPKGVYVRKPGHHIKPVSRSLYRVGNVIFVPLTRGRVAKVSAKDRSLVEGHNWCVSKTKSRRGWYAVRRGNSTEIGIRNKKVFLHRLLLGVPKGTWVDHRNGDTLDNRRRNLRAATPAQNAYNKPALRRSRAGRSSRFVGVSFCADRTRKPWHAYIGVNGKRLHLGRFCSEQRAARERRAAELRLHGAFAPAA
jgi:hypothetical protein